MRRFEPRCQLRSGQAGGGRRQEMVLHFTRHRQFAFHALLFTGNALVQTRILDRNGHLCGQRAHGAEMIFREITSARVLQVQNADHLILVNQRHAQLRARLGIGFDVAGIAGDIGRQHRLFALRRCANQAATDRYVMLELNALLEAYGKPVHQLLLAFVEQQDREHLVIDYLGQQIADALQQLVNIEDGRKVTADLVQQGQRVRLTNDSGVQPRVLNADSDARPDDRQEASVFFMKIAAFAGFKVHHADHPVLVDQRHCQLRVNPGNGFNVFRLFADVGHQDGATLFSCTARHAFAHLDPDSFGDFRRMADLKAEAQLLCALIQQQDGEDFVVDDPLYDLGYPLQQRVQVERRVEDVRDFNQKRFDIHTLRLGGGNHEVDY